MTPSTTGSCCVKEVSSPKNKGAQQFVLLFPVNSAKIRKNKIEKKELL